MTSVSRWLPLGIWFWFWISSSRIASRRSTSSLTASLYRAACASRSASCWRLMLRSRRRMAAATKLLLVARYFASTSVLWKRGWSFGSISWSFLIRSSFERFCRTKSSVFGWFWSGLLGRSTIARSVLVFSLLGVLSELFFSWFIITSGLSVLVFSLSGALLELLLFSLSGVLLELLFSKLIILDVKRSVSDVYRTFWVPSPMLRYVNFRYYLLRKIF